MASDKTQIVQKKEFLLNFIFLFVVEFAFSRTLSIVIFILTSLGSEDFNIKLISMISSSPGGNV